MIIPRRLRQQAGRHALVDGISFALPVASRESPAVMAAFPINAARAAEALPAGALHPIRFRGKAILAVVVIDYRLTTIGSYIEYSIGVACTRGQRPAPLPLAALFRRRFGVGQYVLDLPVSTEISVKGGKGIWGMPKHQANLDFAATDETIRSRYDKDGQMVVELEVQRPTREDLPVRVSATNWCTYRGMLMKSDLYVRARGGFNLFKKGAARLTLGDSPRADVLRHLEIEPEAFLSAYLPESAGTLDDHIESWFLSYPQPPSAVPEGMESVVDLGQGREWLPPPGAVPTPLHPSPHAPSGQSA